MLSSLGSPLRLALLALSLASMSVASAADKPLPKVPEGFTVEVAAGPELTQHPIMAGFDDRGRLFLAETAGLNLPAAELKEKLPNFIRRLEDSDGDGKFDKSTIFADKMTFPQGALWHRGALYVASSGAIWKLEDTDDDGKADKRTKLVSDFGFTGNAADVHGPFLGPEGRIYWCEGRHGHEIRDAKGNLVSQGKAARIFSCEPDGSDVQVFCGGGMDNPVEIDFLPSGEMIGDVNILLHPRGDCLVHWVRGGVYPHDDTNPVWVAEFKRTGDLLGPIHNYGHVAVSGLTRYRSKEFGDDYEGDFFVTLFNTHKVVRTKLERSGSTFKVKSNEDFFVSDDPDCHPTDVFEDADGSLLVIDTGGWFRIGCPTSQIAKPEIAGAIYRIRRVGAHKVDDPRGLKIDFAATDASKIARLLADPRPVVRDRAVDRLAVLNAGMVLDGLISPPPPNGGRVVVAGTDVDVETQREINKMSESAAVRTRAVWASVRPSGRKYIDENKGLQVEGLRRSLVTQAFDDPDESVRIAAVNALDAAARRLDIVTLQRLGRMIANDTPPVRAAAAACLGRNCAATRKIGWEPEAAERLVRSLLYGLRVSPLDRTIEHSIIYALIEIGAAQQTRIGLRDESPSIRRAALIALDQMDGGDLQRDEVTALLDTDDPALQATALDVISRRKGWAAETLSLLKTWLDEETLTPERATVLRGFLLAQTADSALQQLIAETLGRADLPEPHRLLLLEVIQRAGLEKLPEAWIAAVGQSLARSSVEVRTQAVRILQERRIAAFDEALRALATGDHPAELKVDSLLALAPRMTDVEAGVFAFLVSRLNGDVPPLSRLAAARALADLPLSESQLVELATHFDAAGPLAIPVLLRAYSRVPSERAGLVLVKALEESKSATSLSPDEVASMLRAFPAPVQSAGAGLLKKLGIDPEQQRLRLEELEARTENGDAQRGHDIFYGKKAACSGCHAVAGKGGKVGPDLTTIGAIRTQRDLLEAVVFPSASFARGFRTYIVVTVDGRVHTGVISRETADAVFLRKADLSEIRILRKDIDEMQESSTSIMPKGLETTLTNDELRDLLAWLRERK